MYFNSETWNDDVLVVQLPARFLAESVDDFKSTVTSAMGGGNQHVILDFGDTQMLDSSALGAIVAVFKQLSAADGKLILCGVNNAVMALLELTQLQKIFVIEADLATAKASLGG